MRFSRASLAKKKLRFWIEYFESKSESKFEEKKEILATKQDILELRATTQQNIANMKVEMIKWMVGLWIAQMAAIVGLYLTK
ncbi:MAG TPA: hypothetical protein VGM92_08480 [Candidatus Kapabacteria bacterium]